MPTRNGRKIPLDSSDIPALQKFGKAKAIAFGNWLRENQWQAHKDSSGVSSWQKEEAIGYTEATTEQLFQQFIDTPTE